ncbi:hypothetical protein GCM10009775_28990 [Microbacterium aoyamense]|uniref:Uncharacterized protein n=1 Tax=Microbacterium aoyamense TaxID=344166 RepID=A0ABP5B7Q6_9MICO|nr:hypothetical protein [Microbacterium aoyamense]
MSEASTVTVKRPVVVTIAIVLVYITAFASVALGILVLLSRYEVPGDEVLPVSLLGAAIILLGLLIVAVASGLARGSRFSRTLITIYLVISLALRVTTIVTTDGWQWSAITQGILEIAVLAALWLPPGSRFFANAAQVRM